MKREKRKSLDETETEALVRFGFGSVRAYYRLVRQQFQKKSGDREAVRFDFYPNQPYARPYLIAPSSVSPLFL